MGTSDETAAVILSTFTSHPKSVPPGGWEPEETQSNEAIGSWIVEN